MNLKSGYYLFNKCIVLQEELQSVANAAPASFTAAVNKRTTVCVCVCVCVYNLFYTFKRLDCD